MIVSLAWRNVWRNKLRSGIIIGSMVFGLLGLVLMVGFVQAMVKNMVENAIKFNTGHLQIHHPDFLLNEELKAALPGAQTLANEIRQIDNIEGVSVRQVVDGMVGSAAATRGVRINGIKVSDENQVTSLEDNIVEGTTLPETGRNPVLVSRRLAEKLKIRIRSKVVLTFSNLDGEVTGAAFRVCGFFHTPSSAFDEGNVFVRKTDLIPLTGQNRSHEIVIRVKDDIPLEMTKASVAAVVGNRGVLQDWTEIQPVLSAMVNSMGISNAIVIGIFVLAMGFGILNIMLMSVFERKREFGMLMAIGMNNTRIIRLIVLESIFLSTVGALAGIAAGIILIAITGTVGLPFGAMAEGLGAYGLDTVLYPTVPFTTYIIVVVTILATSLLAALYPTRQIVKKRPSTLLTEKH
jgi:ABC-type lipoprotein release transport system permease subunit